MTVARGKITTLNNYTISFKISEKDGLTYFAYGADAFITFTHDENNPNGNLSLRFRGLEKIVRPGENLNWPADNGKFLIEIFHHHSKEEI